jgi:DNA replication protein DnaC
VTRDPQPGTASAEEAPNRPCPFDLCDGSGLVIVEETNTATPCRCRDQVIGRAIAHRSNTRIPKRFRGVSLDRKPLADLDRSVRDPVRAYLEDLDKRVVAGEGLWFYGDVGTGKTSLLMLVGRRALEAGHSVAIYALPQLIAQMQATYDDDSQDSFDAFFTRLCAVDLLVLDDFASKFRYTDWVSDQLYRLVNERWQDERPIVMASTTPEANDGEAVKGLLNVIAKLESAPPRTSPETIGRLVERLEAAIVRLEELTVAGPGDSLGRIRRQLDPRTFSRLIEICGDPLPVMGPDLRLAPPAERP